MTAAEKERTPAGGPGSLVQLPDNASSQHNTGVAVDLEQARLFLQTLDPTETRWHFRTFPDNSIGSGRNYVGAFDDVALQLQLDNGNGRGVFVVVNEGGQRTQDIARVRAVFADFDDEAVVRAKMADDASFLVAGRGPQLAVRSSPGKLHVYWRVDGLALDQFAVVQKSIAEKLGADRSVCDLPRVMRLPGFIHRKNVDAPHRSELVQVVRGEAGIAFTPEQIVSAFPPRTQMAPPNSFANFSPGLGLGDRLTAIGKVVTEGRHEDMLKMAGQLARKVAFEGWREESAFAAIVSERNAGHWQGREMPDEEIRRALHDAVVKCRNGEWKAASIPAANDSVAARHFTTGATKRRGLHFRSAAELMADRTPTSWLIRRRLEQDSLGLIFGDPGTGKSFLAIDWAASIATGTEWQGCKVAAGPVFYIAGEGGKGIRRRLDAWALHKKISLEHAPLYFSAVAASLTAPEGLADAAAEIGDMIERHGKPRLVVLDTLARNFGPGDENKTQDMTFFVDACDRLRETTEACVLVVHHSGHGDKSRARGSMVMKAALDWEYRLTMDKRSGVVTMENVKAKDAEPPDPIDFTLTKVELGYLDDEGDPETSVVLTSTHIAPRSNPGKEGRGKNQSVVLRVLQGALRECADRLAKQADGGEPWVSRNAWRDRCAEIGVSPRAFNDVVRGLAGKEIVFVDGDRVTYDEFAVW